MDRIDIDPDRIVNAISIGVPSTIMLLHQMQSMLGKKSKTKIANFNAYPDRCSSSRFKLEDFDSIDFLNSGRLV